MIIYIFAYLFTTLSNYFAEVFLQKRLSNILLLTNCIILSLIVGLRGESVGVDTHGYYEIFNAINGMSTAEAFLYIEPIWVVLNKLVYYLNFDAPTVILISGFVTNIAIFIAIKKYSPIYSLSICLYLSLAFYFSQFNLIRQALSCSILLLAIGSIAEKKLLKFTLICLIASMIHYPALMFLFTYFFAEKVNFKKNVLLFFWVISLFLLFDGSVILKVLSYFYFIYGDYYKIYVENFAIEDYNRFGIRTIFNQLIFLGIYFTLKNKIINKHEKVVLLISAISILLDNTFNSTAILARISMYWTIFQIIGIAIVFNNIYSHKISINITKLGIIITLLFFYMRLLFQNSNHVLPYHSIFI